MLYMLTSNRAAGLFAMKAQAHEAKQRNLQDLLSVE
jgi:hypothetical protein